MASQQKRSDEQSCPKCGVERSKWGAQSGYSMSGQQYCCQGCAQDTGCRCQSAGRSQSGQQGMGRGREMGGGAARA